MVDSRLPHRAKPSLMHEICRFLRERGETTKSEIYEGIDENQKTLRLTIEYGVALGFLDEDEDRYSLTNRGYGIAYQSRFDGNEAVVAVFQEAIEEYPPYRDAIIAVFERGMTSTVNESRAIEQEAFKSVLEEIVDEEVEGREINVLIKTADAAGLGDYIAGRRGYSTRLVLSDAFEQYVSELADQYAPKRARQEEDESEDDQDVVDEAGEPVGAESHSEQKGLDEVPNGDSGQEGGRTSLLVEVPMSGKSPEEIADVVRRLRSGEF